ncbi:MAG: hypothetical protein RR575_07435 [Acinetobacter sp.]
MSPKPVIKSWFGFLFGLFVVGLSIAALLETWSLRGILATLGFLCFWYPWSQMTGWNKPLKVLFSPKNSEAMGGLCGGLALLAVALLCSSTVVGLIH